MRKILGLLLFILMLLFINVQINKPTVSKADYSKKITTKGVPDFIRGWNYSNIPIGYNNNVSWATESWQTPYDMADIHAAKANTIRVYYDFYDPDKYRAALDAAQANNIKVIVFLWVNHDTSLARNSTYRTQIVTDFKNMVTNLRYHHAIIGWGFGNEVNAHTPSKPDWYATLNQAIREGKKLDSSRFYMTAESEVSDIKTYGNSVPNIDVWGANIYRGTSLGSLHDDVKAATNKPFIITEMGFDRHNSSGEDEAGQAERNLALAEEAEQYKDVISGYLFFEWTDEWGKVGSEWNHDTGPYQSDGDDQDHLSDEEWYGFTEAFYHNAAQSRTKKQSYTTISDFWNSL